MNKNLYINVRRLSLAVVLMVCSLLSVSAENVVKVNGFEIAPGETKVVELILENEDLISTLLFDVTLPTGIEYVDASMTRVDERLDRTEHKVSFDATATINSYRFMARTINLEPIIGNSGAIATITVKATDEFVNDGEIKISNIDASYDGNKVENMAAVNAKVAARVANVAVSYDVTNIDLAGGEMTETPVNVYFEADADIYSLQLDVVLPEGVSIEKKASGSPKYAYGDIVPEEMTISYNQLDGKVRFVFSATEKVPFVKQSGVILSFNLVADEDFSGEVEVGMENIIASLGNAKTVIVDNPSPIVVSNKYLIGDCDENGWVNVLDYAWILDYALGIDVPEVGSKAFIIADVNADGKISVGDLTAVANIINGIVIDQAPARMPMAAAAMEAVRLSMVNEGGANYIVVALDNVNNYVAGQFDIQLPAGMTMVGATLGNRVAQHDLSSNALGNGIHRFIISSVNNPAIANNGDATLLRIEVAGNSNAGASVMNAMFADAMANTYSIDGNGDGTTGINGIEAAAANKVEIYSLGGARTKSAVKGVNILRKSNGTAVKVIK